MGNRQSSLQYRQTKQQNPQRSRTSTKFSGLKNERKLRWIRGDVKAMKVKQREDIYNTYRMSSADILILYLKQKVEYKLYQHQFYPNIVSQEAANLIKVHQSASSSQYSQSSFSKIQVNQSQYPYNCIGLIYGCQETDRIGVGFLISQNLILTSASLITQQNGLPISNIKFYPKIEKNLNKSKVLQIEVTEIRISKNYRKCLKDNKDKTHYNFALLMIKTNIYRQKYINIGYDLQKQKEVQIFGYCFDLVELNLQDKNIKTINKKGKITKINDDILCHNINMNKYSNGSPILIQFIEGYIFVIGICSVLDRQKDQKYACHLTYQKVYIIRQWARQLNGKQTKILPIKMINIQYNHQIQRKSIQKDKSLQQQIIQLQTTLNSNTQQQKSPINQFLTAKLGQLYFIKGQYNKSINILLQGLQLLQKSHGKQSLQSAIFYNGLGLGYDKLKNYGEALRYFEIYLKIYQNIDGQLCKGVATAYNHIGNIYRKQRLANKSLQFYYKSLKIRQSLQGQKSCSVALSLANIAIIEWQNRKYLEAIKKYKRALDIYQLFQDRAHFQISRTVYNLSLCYYDIEEYQLWIQRVDQSFSILRQQKMQGLPCFTKRKQQFIIKIKKILAKTQLKAKLLLNIIKILVQTIKIDHNQQILLILNDKIKVANNYTKNNQLQNDLPDKYNKKKTFQ